MKLSDFRKFQSKSFRKFWDFWKFSKWWFFENYEILWKSKNQDFGRNFGNFSKISFFQKISKIFEDQLWEDLTFFVFNRFWISFFIDRSEIPWRTRFFDPKVFKKHRKKVSHDWALLSPPLVHDQFFAGALWRPLGRLGRHYHKIWDSVNENVQVLIDFGARVLLYSYSNSIPVLDYKKSCNRDHHSGGSEKLLWLLLPQNTRLRERRFWAISWMIFLLKKNIILSLFWRIFLNYFRTKKIS